jgi:hypothetical protein
VSIGGEREVKPGDELLLLALSGARTQPRDASSGFLTSCYARAVIAQYGASVSTHAFTHRLELLDPLRTLGAGEAVIKHFALLGVRYVQLDSLTYLVVSICVNLDLIL